MIVWRSFQPRDLAKTRRERAVIALSRLSCIIREFFNWGESLRIRSVPLSSRGDSSRR
jgi:hypothetical protein